MSTPGITATEGYATHGSASGNSTHYNYSTGSNNKHTIGNIWTEKFSEDVKALVNTTSIFGGGATFNQ